METRRYILAIGLSMLVLVVYLRFFGPSPVEQAPPQPQTAQSEAVAEKAPAPKPQPAATVAKSIAVAAKGRDIVIDTDVIRAVVNTAGGVITKWELKNYREADKEEVGFMVLMKRIFGGEKRVEKPKKPLGNVELFTRYEGVKPEDLVAPLTVTPVEKELRNLAAVEFRPNVDSIRLDKDRKSQTLVLTYTGPAGIAVEKKLTFYHDEYKVGVFVSTKGLDGYALALGTDFGLSDKISSDAASRVGIAALVDGKTIVEKSDSIKVELQHTGAIGWFGQEDKYFTATLISDAPGIVTTKKTPAPKEIGDLLSTELLVKDKPESQTFTLYAGPKSFNLLKAYGKGLEQMVDYGWFGVLAKPMFWLMEQFFFITRNYGIAIILLT
ncbi:MAG: membrane protein insertase YidC, partial [Nitrospirae bacterium]|nr:membrane protein insertase YidC [Nitrospirota bacterium]